MARQNGSAVRHAQPKQTAKPYWPPIPPKSGLHMPAADSPGGAANAEANGACACNMFVATTEASFPVLAAHSGAGAEAETEVAAEAETEAVQAEVACSTPSSNGFDFEHEQGDALYRELRGDAPVEESQPGPTQQRRLRADLPPNDLRLRLSRSHC